jgi:RNA polymerase sigma-70 factor (ECF subfamily)
MTVSPNDEEDRLAMSRLAQGHDAALNELMERHGERLYHFIHRVLQNETEAVDLAQEAFVRIYQNKHKFNVSQKFSTWLFTIATNLARDRIRWRRRHPTVSMDAENPITGYNLRETLPDASNDPSEDLERRELAEQVSQAIGELPEDQRTALILSEYENLSAIEIAEVLRCSPKAVENKLYRARKGLKSLLPSLLGT